MKKYSIFLLTLSIVLFTLTTTTFAGSIIYVDANTPGNDDGSGWAKAYKYLQDALASANFNPAVNEIRVAEGVYRPDQSSVNPNGSGDRNATFQLNNGITLKGGYAGYGQQDPNVRNIELYETILSGDLDGNDIDVAEPCDLLLEPTRGENSYHVVSTNETDASAVLDGVTIMNGNANGNSQPIYWGAGIYNENLPTPDWECTTAGPTISNCKIIKNSAAGEGGGIYNRYSCQPQIINCDFIENMAKWGGGAIKNDTSNPAIINCTFTNNFAGDPLYSHGDGGAIDNEESSPIITNSTFIGNSADYGGAVGNWMGGCNPKFVNCVFSKNSAEYGGVMWTSNNVEIGNGTHPELINCTLVGNSATANGSAFAFTKGSFGLIPSNLQLTNCILWDEGNEIWNDDGSTITITYSDVQGNWPGLGNINADPCFVDPNNADHHLSQESPCINTGDPNYVPEPNEIDLDGNRRISGDRIDMGAYEYFNTEPTIQADLYIYPTSIVRHNRAKRIMAVIRLPRGITKDEIDSDTKLVLYPGGIEAKSQVIRRRRRRRVTILAYFDKAELMNAIENNGRVELQAVGQLKSGQSFYGEDSVTIRTRRRRDGQGKR